MGNGYLHHLLNHRLELKMLNWQNKRKIPKGNPVNTHYILQITPNTLNCRTSCRFPPLRHCIYKLLSTRGHPMKGPVRKNKPPIIGYLKKVKVGIHAIVVFFKKSAAVHNPWRSLEIPQGKGRRYQAKQETGRVNRSKNCPWGTMDISWNNTLQIKVGFARTASYRISCPRTQNSVIFIAVSLGRNEHLEYQKYEINSKTKANSTMHEISLRQSRKNYESTSKDAVIQTLFIMYML